MIDFKNLNKPLTRKGYDRLAEEHRQLLEEVRPGVVEGIAIAAAEGDRSENAEYIYGKKRLREIDKKLRQLTGYIKDAEVIDPEFINSDVICFGAFVTVEASDGKQKVWQLVGNGEADADRGSISWKSPVARALMNKQKGDIVIVERPIGEIEYCVIDFSFKCPIVSQ